MSLPFVLSSENAVIFPEAVPEGGLTAALDIQIRTACFDAFLRGFVDYCKAHAHASEEDSSQGEKACLDTAAKILEAAVTNGDLSSGDYEATLEGLQAYYGADDHKIRDFAGDCVTLLAAKANAPDAAAFKEVYDLRQRYLAALEDLKNKYLPLFKQNVDGIVSRYGAMLPADFIESL